MFSTFGGKKVADGSGSGITGFFGLSRIFDNNLG